MARLDCDHETVAGVTLVECRLASDVRERVTVEPIHDGPIWPPRRQGVPAAGWRDGTWTGVVEPETTRGLGYATPADVGDRPVRLVDADPATDEAEDAISARAVVRSLGDPSPPRDALPPASARETADDPARRRATSPDPPGTPGTITVSEDAPTADDPSPVDRRAGSTPRSGGCDDGGVAAPLLYEAIEARLATAERLAAASSVPEAREAVAAAGGMAAVRSLVGQLAADREHLEARRDRSGRLADRIGAVEVPIEALDRLV